LHFPPDVLYVVTLLCAKFAIFDVTLFSLVFPGNVTTWLGCGRKIFPLFVHLIVSVYSSGKIPKIGLQFTTLLQQQFNLSLMSVICGLQCFDNVAWVAGRASSL